MTIPLSIPIGHPYHWVHILLGWSRPWETAILEHCPTINPSKCSEVNPDTYPLMQSIYLGVGAGIEWCPWQYREWCLWWLNTWYLEDRGSLEGWSRVEGRDRQDNPWCRELWFWHGRGKYEIENYWSWMGLAHVWTWVVLHRIRQFGETSNTQWECTIRWPWRRPGGWIWICASMQPMGSDLRFHQHGMSNEKFDIVWQRNRDCINFFPEVHRIYREPMLVNKNRSEVRAVESVHQNAARRE